MSSEKYERPNNAFPVWVDSVEDEELVVDALTFDPNLDRSIVFFTKKHCERFVNNKRNLSTAQGGKY